MCDVVSLARSLDSGLCVEEGTKEGRVYIDSGGARERVVPGLSAN